MSMYVYIYIYTFVFCIYSITVTENHFPACAGGARRTPAGSDHEGQIEGLG